MSKKIANEIFDNYCRQKGYQSVDSLTEDDIYMIMLEYKNNTSDTNLLANLSLVAHILGSDTKMLNALGTKDISDLREELFQEVFKVIKEYYPEIEEQDYRK